MRLYIHEKNLFRLLPKRLGSMLIFGMALIVGLILFCATVICVESRNFAFALIILVPFGAPLLFFLAFLYDRANCYIEIDDSAITEVHFLYKLRREKRFPLSEIASAKSVAYYNYPSLATNYIVFFSADNRRLFRIIDIPEHRSALWAAVAIPISDS